MAHVALPRESDAGTGVAALHEFARRHRRLFVLGGAGVSTDSGIPDYRDAKGAWKSGAPILNDEFRRSAAVRRRYWARSMHGWPRIAAARPNPAHRALARLEQLSRVEILVTQNVDGLHLRAGSRRVIELHGALGHVDCIDCGASHTRDGVQCALENDNPRFAALAGATAPDGDVDLGAADLDRFRVPSCTQCGGMLKPAVVFFGENVPRARVLEGFEALHRADAMLVVGSSLMVYSGFRFCERAAQLQRPIAAINLGRTRADALFAVKVEASCATALTSLVDVLERDGHE
ncbi:MAG: NAD-dependent protein deacetylase [Betaproteobacteria bacterium]